MPSFLPLPTLCIVKHSTLEFLALPSPGGEDEAPLLAKVAQANFNARVLQVSPLSNGTRLAVLTDHHNPRLIVLQAGDAAGQAASSSSSSSTTPRFNIVCDRSILLDEMTRPPAELGLGVWTVSAPNDEVLVAHVHSGVLKVLPAGKAKSKAASSQMALNTFTAR